MPVETIENPSCITVAQLKALIADWPETNRDGEPTEVWIETGWCLSSPVVGIGPLNIHNDHDGKKTADIIFISALYAKPDGK